MKSGQKVRIIRVEGTDDESSKAKLSMSFGPTNLRS